MYAAKAATGGAPGGQVQGQPGVPSSGQGMCGFFIHLYVFPLYKVFKYPVPCFS